MAGTLEITDELCWMPASWVYDNALEAIASCTSDAEVETLLLGALTEANGGHLDLRAVNIESMLSIRNAAKEAYRQFEASGAIGFTMPEYYDGFMKQFGLLIEMIESRTT